MKTTVIGFEAGSPVGWSAIRTGLLSLCLGIFALLSALPVPAAQGVTGDTIRVAGVMDLEGRSRGLGLGMKRGIEAAFAGQRVRGYRIEYVTLDDSYTPEKTVEATRSLLDQDVFAFVGNVGTPTSKVALPLLAERGVPAVGFFTGAGLLRPGVGDVVNFRASYVQETAEVINKAIDAGVPVTGICAYVQNDAYGMAGVEGIRQALSGRPGTRNIIEALNRIIDMEGEDPPRNGIGPVGVYQRNTFVSRDGYDSLKAWEAGNGVRCQVVVSVGTYNSIARFVGYSRYRGDDWIVSAVSFTGADDFRKALADLQVHDRVVMTQVVPPLDSDLPIVTQARRALGDDFGYVTLEGYIVGQMFLAALEQVEGPMTRENFLRAVRGKVLEVGGLSLDFRRDNQGSDLVVSTYLDGGEYRAMTSGDWRRLMAVGR
ncbi:MAG: ABC transporter substrate-binding protein [Gammaproteobacteria bacterium]|nr:ABC transporter substrate-binding protein [Gammaproteobacteria bacterium]